MSRPSFNRPALSLTSQGEPADLAGYRVKGRVRLGEVGKARVGVDRAVAEVAARQHGIVGRKQLRELGLGERAIDHRVQAGRLHRVHRAVYAVGHPLLTRDGRWLAAVLAGGEGAILSHRSAAELLGLLPPDEGPTEIIVPCDRRDRPGLILHQGRVRPDERTAVRGVAVTTVARTLLDLASTVDDRTLRRAIHEAEVHRLLDRLAVDSALAGRRRRRGVGRLTAALADRGLGSARTRTELELRFLELVADQRLPAPRANLRVSVGRRSFEVDFAWPEKRLIAELDGHAVHATREKFERDRERDRVLSTAGWRVVRITWRQLHDDPDAIVADLRSLLVV